MKTVHIVALREILRQPKDRDLVERGQPSMTDDARQVDRYIRMRSALRYLMEYAIIYVRSGYTTANALEAAHQLTRPELLRNPELGEHEMTRLSEQHRGDEMQEFYAFASDVFSYGIQSRGNDLERFLWETPATKVQIALELIALLSVGSNTTMGRTLLEVDEHLREALAMLQVPAPIPAGEPKEIELPAAAVTAEEDAEALVI